MGRPHKKHLPLELSTVLRQIGANLAHLRRQKGFTQAEIARRSGISITTINEIETRQSRDIRLSTLSQIARCLDVEMLELMEGSDVELNSQDQAQLLKAGETILRITRKLR